MGPKKGRRVRKIKVPTDSVPEFELSDTVTDIQRMREEREEREREEQAQKREGKSRREEARRDEATLKQRLEERQEHHNHHTQDTRRAA